jgi:hypothetical protein
MAGFSLEDQSSLPTLVPTVRCSDLMASDPQAEALGHEYPEWLDPRLCMSRAANRDPNSSHNLSDGEPEFLDTIVVQGPEASSVSWDLEQHASDSGGDESRAVRMFPVSGFPVVLLP